MSEAPSISEKSLYRPIRDWLDEFLRRSCKRNATINSFDTSRQSLSVFIERKGLNKFFHSDLWRTYDIKVDITSFILYDNSVYLAFVECKVHALTLRDLSQILGYSRVALPILSILMSPAGISDSLTSLLKKYDRIDILEYHWPPGRTPWSLIIAQWDTSQNHPLFSSIFPPGALANFKLSK